MELLRKTSGTVNENGVKSAMNEALQKAYAMANGMKPGLTYSQAQEDIRSYLGFCLNLDIETAEEYSAKAAKRYIERIQDITVGGR